MLWELSEVRLFLPVTVTLSGLEKIHFRAYLTTGMTIATLYFYAPQLTKYVDAANLETSVYQKLVLLSALEMQFI